MKYVVGLANKFDTFVLAPSLTSALKHAERILSEEKAPCFIQPALNPDRVYMAGVKDKLLAWNFYDNEKEALEYRDARAKYFSHSGVFCYELEELCEQTDEQLGD